MKKSDLHITINVPELPPEMLEQLAKTNREFGRAGVSVAEAGAALAAAAPHFVRMWDGVLDDLRYNVDLLDDLRYNVDLLGISLTDYWEKLKERKAQQRAQLVLLLVFILLTMLVGLL